jgi:5-methylcytosine-specific restriction enzyme A
MANPQKEYRYVSQNIRDDWRWRRDFEKAKLLVWKRDNGTCSHCKTKSDKYDVDHIIPLSWGGNYFDINNLQTLCRPCHKIKTINERRKNG